MTLSLNLYKVGVFMKNITISQEAYTEFKAFLEENKITDFNIRINFAGFACSGPILSSEENEGNGLSLKPVIAPEGGCGGSCSGCH